MGEDFGQPRLYSPDDSTIASDKALEHWLSNSYIGVVEKVKAPDYPTIRKSAASDYPVS
uniref:Uncharacterized protein n=1 Tax=Arundo donax TaxID=35708 RepID=A0A0A9B5K6_ARUDO